MTTSTSWSREAAHTGSHPPAPDREATAVAANPYMGSDRQYFDHVRQVLRDSRIQCLAAGAALWTALDCLITFSIPGLVFFGFFVAASVYLMRNAEGCHRTVRQFLECDRVHLTQAVEECKATIKAEVDFNNFIFGMLSRGGGIVRDGGASGETLEASPSNIVTLNGNPWRQ